MNTTRRHVLTAALFAATAASALAQTFPAKPIRIVVPYPPGSNPDVLARLLSENVGTRLRQPLVVDNRAGAGGTLGTDVVAKALPDGYTLGLGDTGPLGISPWLYSKLSYSAKDFVPVASLVSVPMVLVVPGSSPIKTVGDLVTSANTQATPLLYGSLGVGSIHHLGVELLSSVTGMKLSNVPYKGNGEMAVAVLNNEVQFAYSGIPAVEAFIKDGRMRAIAVTTERRSRALPNVPTFQEQGIKDYDVAPTIGIIAPAGTPAARIQLIQDAFLDAIKDEKINERLISLGMLPRPALGSAYGARITTELEKYGKIVKAARIQPQ